MKSIYLLTFSVALVLCGCATQDAGSSSSWTPKVSGYIDTGAQIRLK